jgi:hypothetical protein
MVGVPLLALGILLMPKNRALSGKCFLAGTLLQLIGHYVFEHNKPVLMEYQSLGLLKSAVLFVTHQWKRVATGKHIVNS